MSIVLRLDAQDGLSAFAERCKLSELSRSHAHQGGVIPLRDLLGPDASLEDYLSPADELDWSVPYLIIRGELVSAVAVARLILRTTDCTHARLQWDYDEWIGVAMVWPDHLLSEHFPRRAVTDLTWKALEATCAPQQWQTLRDDPDSYEFDCMAIDVRDQLQSDWQDAAIRLQRAVSPQALREGSSLFNAFLDAGHALLPSEPSMLAAISAHADQLVAYREAHLTPRP